MRRHPIVTWLTVLLLAAASVALAACGGDDESDTGTAASTAPAPAATEGQTTGEAGGGGAGGDLSAQVSAGEQVFSESCAACHGSTGGGGSAPPVIGDGADLSSHGDGAGLLEFISENMPASAPGSLSEQQYLDVTAYILDGNGDLKEPLTNDNAGQVSLSGGG